MKVRDFVEWVLLGAIWGASFLFTRIAAPEFGPFALVEVRLGSAALFLSALVFFQAGWPHIRRHWKSLLLVGAINSAIPFTLFAYATLSLTAGDASVLNATAPLFGAALGWLLFCEVLGSGRILGLLLGFLGVVILVWNKLSATDNYLAILAGLSAAILYGLASHVTTRRLRGVPSLVVSTGTLLFSTFLLLPTAILGWPAENPSLKSWAAAISLGVLCSAIAFLLFFRLLQSVGPTRAMTVAYLIPAFGIFWGWLVLAEPVSLTTLCGGAVIVAGTALVHFAKKPVPVPVPIPTTPGETCAQPAR